MLNLRNLSKRFANGGEWKGRNVYVFGTGTSAHDIAQDLHGNGAHTTIVQRSPTLIVNVEPSAQLYDGVYYGKGPTLEDRDLINVSFPLSVMKQAHKILTDKTRELDKPLLAVSVVFSNAIWGMPCSAASGVASVLLVAVWVVAGEVTEDATSAGISCFISTVGSNWRSFCSRAAALVSVDDG